ncbi:unnamed protein product [Rangifer tarandus platyrhynchus]|uniref:Uncharacterized protein n=1 Tax=Rangifer tarandus platyrhynchus TaxID=3082113 RepID=A0AC59ZQZ3_RANTA
MRGMLELPWSINEGHVEALAPPQPLPHPTLLDAKPEASLHPLPPLTAECSHLPRQGVQGAGHHCIPLQCTSMAPSKVSLGGSVSGAFQGCACYSLCQPAYPLP